MTGTFSPEPLAARSGIARKPEVGVVAVKVSWVILDPTHPTNLQPENYSYAIETETCKPTVPLH